MSLSLQVVILMPISWLWRNRWVLIALALCPVAYIVPKHLIQSGYHVPVGVYIAIMGVVAAAATFRKEPSVGERAAWILLITLLMVAEIRNLYIADATQSHTFQTIATGLQDTSTQLDATSNKIEQQFGEVKNRFNSVDTQDSQLRKELGETSFQSLVRRHGKLRADIAALDDKMGSRLALHVKSRRGLDQGSHQDPALVLAAQQKEDKRYQQEFEDQFKPHL